MLPREGVGKDPNEWSAIGVDGEEAAWTSNKDIMKGYEAFASGQNKNCSA